MTVEFGCITHDPATLMKGFDSLEDKVILSNVEVKKPCSILTPTLLISKAQYDSMLTKKCNYCKISKFSRFYFMGDAVVTTGGRVEIPCSVDVLESNKIELMDCFGYVTRSGAVTQANKYLRDNNVPIKTKTVVKNIPFSTTPFNVVSASAPLGKLTYNYVLTVIGGGTNLTPPTP